MELFISCSTALQDGRDVLEDAIEEYLGHGAEVTGGGVGIRGWNVDVDALRELDEEELRGLCRFLINFGVDSTASVDIYTEGSPNRRISVKEFAG